MIGILLLNLGTPDAPTTSAVRRYLREFLMDPHVIDMPTVPRKLLVEGVIVPFRAPKSAEAYQKIWQKEGSPLLYYSDILKRRVQEKLGVDYKVVLGMRYGNPSIETALQELIEAKVTEIRILPLYPQYARSTTHTGLEKIEQVMAKLSLKIPLAVLPPFYTEPNFISACHLQAEPVLADLAPDHVLFSFHGLPERHITKADPTESHCLQKADCCEQESHQAFPTCYRAQCFKTAQALAERCNLNSTQYTITFQSRLGRTPWLKPYTDLILPELAAQGKKRLAVFCPSFVSDCLETLEEIGMRGKELFLNAGGERLEVVPCPNDHPVWIDAVCGMVGRVSR